MDREITLEGTSSNVPERIRSLERERNEKETMDQDIIKEGTSSTVPECHHAFIPVSDHYRDPFLELEVELEVELRRERILWSDRSIFEVPPYFRRHNMDAYNPKVVSLGPFHHGQKHLKPMEDHKKRALSHFLKRTRCTYKVCYDKLEEAVPKLMDHYEHLDKEWQDKHKFLKLMVYDGCFMLEFLLNYARFFDDYDEHDPIFGRAFLTSTMFVSIRRDMLLIENQLPLLVLEKLLDLYKTQGLELDRSHTVFMMQTSIEDPVAFKEAPRFTELWYWIDDREPPFTRKSSVLAPHGVYNGSQLFKGLNGLILSFFGRRHRHATGDGKCLHVLDVLRESMIRQPEKPKEEETALPSLLQTPVQMMRSCLPCLVPTNRRREDFASKKDDSKNSNPMATFPSATVLSKTGVKLKASNRFELLVLDIHFNKKVLSLPYMYFDEDAEDMFLNLMALERLHVKKSHEVSSYVAFMDKLIRSAEDVELLRSHDIISPSTLSDDVIAKLFNKIANNPIAAPDHSLNEVKQLLSERYGERKNRIRLACVEGNIKCSEMFADWISHLMQNYCKNPWTVIGVIAGTIILTATVTQTVYTVLSFYNKKGP